MSNYQGFPHCDICDAGGISQSDCPNCHTKIIPWYQNQRNMLSQDNERLKSDVEAWRCRKDAAECAMNGMVDDMKHLQERLAGLQLCYIEAKEAARWLYSMADDRESANAVSNWPWLEKES